MDRIAPFRKCAATVALLCAVAWLMAAPAAAQSESPAVPDGQAWYDFGGGGSFLGVYLEDLSGAMRRALGLDEETGVLLQRVSDDGPASRAGLLAGDVLLRLGGKRTDSSSGLSRVLDRFDPDEEVEAVVWRQGKEKKFQVTLGQRRGYAYSFSNGVLAEVPEISVAPRVMLPRLSFGGFGAGSESLGVKTEELTGQLAEFFQVPRGVLITWVVRDSAAHKAGLKAGDVIVGLEDLPIQNRADLEQTLVECSGMEKVQVRVMRRGKEQTFSLTP